MLCRCYNNNNNKPVTTATTTTAVDALQMFLDDAIGVTSKIHSCTSGDELATLGRFLTQHFETQARRNFEIRNHFR